MDVNTINIDTIIGVSTVLVGFILFAKMVFNGGFNFKNLIWAVVGIAIMVNVIKNPEMLEPLGKKLIDLLLIVLENLTKK
jgi:hypothetical protein